MEKRSVIPVDRVGTRRTAPGGIKQKYVLTPEGRQLLIERYDGSSEQINELSKALNVPRTKVRQWAHDMGITRTKMRWDDEEVAFLKKNIRKMSLLEIADHLHMNHNTVRRKARQLGLDRGIKKDGYMLEDITVGFGVYARVAYLWIEKGWLKGRKQKIGVSGEVWYFSDAALKDFILSHPDQINPRKLSQESWLWIVDILAGNWGIGRLDDDVYGEKE